MIEVMVESSHEAGTADTPVRGHCGTLAHATAAPPRTWFDRSRVFSFGYEQPDDKARHRRCLSSLATRGHHAHHSRAERRDTIKPEIAHSRKRRGDCAAASGLEVLSEW